MSKRPLNVGLIGGGAGAFIVQPHQKAIHMDGTRRVVAAALHPDPKIAMDEAQNWPYPIKGYESYDEMIAEQKNLPAEQKLDYILIVTPNFVHFDPALKAIEAGIAVLCEKPLAISTEQAQILTQTAKDKKIPFGVAHTYLGHWTSWFSRFIVQSGLIGDVRWVDASYLQGWLATMAEKTSNMQAQWRTDPKKSGASLCGGDIGTHALMQLRFVTGLDVEKVSAHLETYVEGRTLDDHFTSYCKLSNGASAMVRASQICIGHKNDLKIEVIGTKGAITWIQEEPEKVVVSLIDQPDRVYYRGAVTPNDGFLKEVPEYILKEPKIPAGHPEGFHDAYSRLHREFENDVRKWQAGEEYTFDNSRYATVFDGWMGLSFIDACVESNKAEGKWVDVKKFQG